jgi:multidrug transporter EmrE-like cation transporter
MNKYIFLLAISSIFLSSLAQVTLKLGMSQPDILNAISNVSIWSIVKAISTNFYVIAGLTLYFSSAAVWLFVLAKVDVSVAYPFVGIGFIITMILAYFINHEALSLAKISGTLMITVGIFMISRA